MTDSKATPSTEETHAALGRVAGPDSRSVNGGACATKGTTTNRPAGPEIARKVEAHPYMVRMHTSRGLRHCIIVERPAGEASIINNNEMPSRDRDVMSGKRMSDGCFAVCFHVEQSISGRMEFFLEQQTVEIERKWVKEVPENRKRVQSLAQPLRSIQLRWIDF